MAAAERALGLLGELSDERDSRYIRFKALCADSMSHNFVGDLIKARALAKELLDFANTSASRRALALAHMAMGGIQRLIGDNDRAGNESALARDGAPDPFYKAIADVNLGAYLANSGKLVEAKAVIEPALLFAESNGQSSLALAQRANQGMLLLGDGELNKGMNQLEQARTDAETYGSRFIEIQFRGGIATIYARIATGEGMASGGKLGTIMRNPGFALGRARKASQTARDMLMDMSTNLPSDFEGFRFVIEFELAKLLIKRKEAAEARKHLEKAIEFLRPIGDGLGMRDARALLASLDAK